MCILCDDASEGSDEAGGDRLCSGRELQGELKEKPGAILLWVGGGILINRRPCVASGVFSPMY